MLLTYDSHNSRRSPSLPMSGTLHHRQKRIRRRLMTVVNGDTSIILMAVRIAPIKLQLVVVNQPWNILLASPNIAIPPSATLFPTSALL